MELQHLPRNNNSDLPLFRTFLQAFLAGSVLTLLAHILLVVLFLCFRIVPAIDHLRGPGALPQNFPSGTFLPLERFPGDLRRAVLALEDPGFYSHWGVDPLAVRHAIKLNLSEQYPTYGGSSINQQLARTLFLNTEKSLTRKSLEIGTALILEHSLSKHRILELYMNTVPLGPGIYGFSDAARHYMHAKVISLSDDQKISLLAVMPSPILYTPETYQDNPALAERARAAKRFFSNWHGKPRK